MTARARRGLRVLLGAVALALAAAGSVAVATPQPVSAGYWAISGLGSTTDGYYAYSYAEVKRWTSWGKINAESFYPINRVYKGAAATRVSRRVDLTVVHEFRGTGVSVSVPAGVTFNSFANTCAKDLPPNYGTSISYTYTQGDGKVCGASTYIQFGYFYATTDGAYEFGDSKWFGVTARASKYLI